MNLLKNLDGKNSSLKQRIIGLCINDGDFSLADLSKELDTSIPTTTKLVAELVEDGLLIDMGKVGTNGGRRPSIFGLNPSAGYFVGVDIRRKFISFAVSKLIYIHLVRSDGRLTQQVCNILLNGGILTSTYFIFLCFFAPKH